MKKLFTALIVIGLSTSMTKTFAWVNSSYFDGFYAGIGVGASQTQSDLNANTLVNFTRPQSGPIRGRALGGILDSNFYKNSIIGDIHFGYEHRLGWTPFYLGGELFGNLGKRQVNASYTSQADEIPAFPFASVQTTDVKTQLNSGEFGFDVRPGILLTPTSLFYGRIGAAFNELTLKSNSSFTLSDLTTNNTHTSLLSAKNSQNIAGLRLGLGLEEYLTNHWGLTIDYIYTNYPHIKTTGITNTINVNTNPPTPNGFTNSADAKLTTETALLGINYYFDTPSDFEPLLAFIPQSSSILDGLYIGAKGGVLEAQTNESGVTQAAAIFGNVNAAPNVEILSYSQNNNKFTNAGIGSLFLGYGQLIPSSPFYLSVELFLNGLSNPQITTNAGAFDIRTSGGSGSGNDTILKGQFQTKLNSFEWGDDIRAGLMISRDTLLYGRVGVVVNELSFQTQNSFQFINKNVTPTLILTSPLFLSANKTVEGLRLGIGLEKYLGKHFSGNIDYIYTDYGNINLNGAANTIATDRNGTVIFVTTNGLISQTKTNVTTQAVLFGLTYHFGYRAVI